LLAFAHEDLDVFATVPDFGISEYFLTESFFEKMTKTIVRHTRGRPPKSRRFLLKKAFEKTSFAPGKDLEKPSFALEKGL
jgi:hypothetical protein